MDQPGVADGVYYGIAVALRQAFPAVGSVLDVGCGTGRLLAHLGNVFPRADGLDLDPDCVALAKEKTRGVVITGPAKNLPQISRWDLVVSWQVLEHCMGPEDARQTVATLRHVAPLHVHSICLAPPESYERDEPRHTCLLSRKQWLAIFGSEAYAHRPDLEDALCAAGNWEPSPELFAYERFTDT